MKLLTDSFKRKSNRRQGFTLVELIVVIVIILVLSAVLVPQVLRYIARAQKAVCAENKHVVYLHSTTSYTDGTYGSLEEAFNALYDSEKESCPSGGTYTIEMADDGYSGKIICSVHDADNDSGNDDTPKPELDPVKNFTVGDYVVTVAGQLEDFVNKSVSAGTIFYYNGEYYFARNPTSVPLLHNLGSNADVVKVKSTNLVDASNAQQGEFAIVNGNLSICYENWWRPNFRPVNATKQT